MAVTKRVISGLYRDSVTLMRCASQVEALPGVQKAGAMMATSANIDLAREAGLLGTSESIEAGPNDLLLLVQSDSFAEADSAFTEAERILNEIPAASGGEVAGIVPRSIRMGVDALTDASLALISTPGEYAASEALKAINLGLDAMVFSDNVSTADEIELKRTAHERGLLVMGPDCGTAIIGGIPLGFANVVRRGDIGVVGASGTGTQQVTALIDRWGAGVTHAIGTGSHDLSSDVGGITMLDALAALEADPATKVLLLVSKPPAPEVAERILAVAAGASTPAVVCFLGADPDSVARPGIRAAETLEDAAGMAVELSLGEAPERAAEATDLEVEAEQAAAALSPSQRYIRGLFSGGTFGYEASLLLSKRLGTVHSNTPAKPEDAIADVWKSEGNTVIDLGDDVFTRGRPHPMIDFRLRVERIAQEAADPEVAVVLLDVVLGYGAHSDPAGQLIPAIAAARALASAEGRALAFVASVCGTEGDPQGLSSQERVLRDAGVLLGRSNAHATRIAADIVEGRQGGEGR